VSAADVAVASRAAAADRQGALPRPARLPRGASPRLPQRLRRVVRKRGRVRVTVSARDSRRLMAASKRRVLVRRR
jgi:hypothetical protein